MQSSSIVSLLFAIAHGSEFVHARRPPLARAPTTSRSLEQMMSTCELSHACRLLTSQIAELQRLVTGFDHEVAGTEVGSLTELGLRAQTLAIVLTLDELLSALPGHASHTADLLTGRLHTIDDVVSYVFDVLGRANRRWISRRVLPIPSGDEQLPEPFKASRTLVYGLAMRRAQRAIVALSTDRDIIHLLRVGTSLANAPEVSQPCNQLAQLLTFTRIPEPDPELLLAAAVLEPDQLVDLDPHGVGAYRAHPAWWP